MARFARRRRARGSRRRRLVGVKRNRGALGRLSAARRFVSGALSKYGPAAVRAGAAAAGAYRRYKRSRAASVVSQQKRRKLNPSNKMQYVQTKEMLGRKQPVTSLLRRLDNRSAFYDIYRFGGSNRQTDTVGYWPLFLKEVVAGTSNAYPVHVISLDQRPYGSSSSTSPISSLHIAYGGVNAGAVYKEVLATVNPAPFSQFPKGIDNDGTALTTNMQTLRSTSHIPYGASTARPENSILEYVQAKFLFRTPNRRSGWIRVQLVQFADRAVDPENWNGAGAPTLTKSLWSYLADESCYNSITAQGQRNKDKSSSIKVLKTWTRRFQPGDSTDLDVTNNQIRLDLFIRLNRICNYRIQAPDRVDIIDDDKYIQDVQQDVGHINALPGDQKARMYFIVQCSNFDAPATVAFDPDKHVSYDMELRAKHVYRTPF